MAERSKGFAYCESFSQLWFWSEDGVDPLQRANTPLFPRPCGKKQYDESGSNVMLIHDYAGGYNDYESCQGADVEKQMYTCNYLQDVEAFVYFSHRLVTIPPPTWINTCHRNGVKVMGTFMVEPGSIDAARILEEDAGRFWVAEKLARIAKQYGFDGWLINLEMSFPILSWSASKLKAFLRQLRDDLGSNGKIVWYDALTTFNFVWYQNTLNFLNLPFALAAGSILTNYAWNPDLARRGKRTAEQSGLGVANLYFGIDVWAQNVQRDPKHPRVTWPSPGGGGTGTGLGMRDLQDVICHKGHRKESSLSTGVFAPAWSFEHFPNNSHAVDKAMWLGERLPSNIVCGCGSESLHKSIPYEHNSVSNYSRRVPSGTSAFFHTDFQQAVSQRPDGTLYAHLGAQAVLPRDRSTALETTDGHVCGTFKTDIFDFPARFALSIYQSRQEATSPTSARARITMADLAISQDGGYVVTVKYRRSKSLECKLAIVVVLEDSEFEVDLPSADEVRTKFGTMRLEGSRVLAVQLGVNIPDTSVLPADATNILEIFEITLQPVDTFGLHCSIEDVRVETECGVDDGRSRLVWTFTHSGRRTGLPFSEVTGPCSHFLISINGEEARRAYAFEYLLPVEADKRLEEIEVEITAVGFDGRVIGKSETVLAEEDTWVVVSS